MLFLVLDISLSSPFPPTSHAHLKTKLNLLSLSRSLDCQTHPLKTVSFPQSSMSHLFPSFASSRLGNKALWRGLIVPLSPSLGGEGIGTPSFPLIGNRGDAGMFWEEKKLTGMLRETFLKWQFLHWALKAI